MHQFEIELSSHEAMRFDAAFWRFLDLHYSASDQPDVKMSSAKVGDREQRSLRFCSKDALELFVRYRDAQEAAAVQKAMAKAQLLQMRRDNVKARKESERARRRSSPASSRRL